MSEKDFGGKFPSHGKSSGQRDSGKFKTPPFPSTGRPKAKVNAGSNFPKSGNSTKKG